MTKHKSKEEKDKKFSPETHPVNTENYNKTGPNNRKMPTGEEKTLYFILSKEEK